ncbi:MAG: GTP 3',8-cyclase MoaA [Firmicutes bacterium]|jgi:cyclic pyranopterin phosphate synthase|nr:GTP 3',8-cyclase MoaA [Bacillota bacterium]
MPLIDSFGRRIEYLRMSVTDKCDLRCVYCMPPSGVALRSHDEVLRNEEFARVARVAVGLGITKIRVTGGEPLVRRGIVDLVREIAAIPGLRDLAMTTNGQRLDVLAGDLVRAGLRRVNVSLDSMRPDTYSNITRGGDLARVISGIAAAERSELVPIRLNVVVLGGVNDGEIEDFARLTFAKPWDVRFIEAMPFAGRLRQVESRHVPIAEVRARVAALARHGLERLPTPGGENSSDWQWPGGHGGLSMGPADYARLPGAVGRVGFIGYSGHEEGFCSMCNRLRITCDGKVRPCLVERRSVDLRGPLRGGASDEELAEVIVSAVRAKPAGRNVTPGGHAEVADSMNQVGG